MDGPALFGRLKSIAVSNASACLNGSQDYSQVLSVLGVKKDLAKASMRFGLGRFNQDGDIQVAVNEVVRVVKELRQMEKEFQIQTGFKAHDLVDGECLND